MKRQWCAVFLTLAAWVLATPSEHHRFSDPDPKITLIVEADDTAATAAIEESAKDFTHETGIDVVIEKFGYALSMKKAAEDLGTKSGHYDVVIQNTDGLVKFAGDRSIYSVNELELATGKKADFEADLYTGVWQNHSWWNGKRYG
jgi:ABC-type glycerol-3-phosphate transport system substrate-binding protein